MTAPSRSPSLSAPVPTKPLHRHAWLLAAAACLALAACSPPDNTPDSGGGTFDAGPKDTGSADTGPGDATEQDAVADSSEDTGQGDSGAADTTDTGGDDTSGGGDTGKVCVPFGHHCVGKVIHDCAKDGTVGDAIKTCGEKEACVPQAADKDLRKCAPVVCEAGKTVCEGKAVKACNATGTGFSFTSCKGFLCQEGKCSDSLKCVPKSKRCEDGKVLACDDAGAVETNETNCPADTSCVEDAKAGTASCVKKICVPSQPACVGEVLSSCSGDGTTVLAGGTDCTQSKESCLVVGGTAQCAAPSCGDGKVNDAAEECDAGKNNGKPGVLCSAKCKKLDDSCLTVADCKALSLPPCSLGWGCVAGKCAAEPAIAAVCDDDNPCTVSDQCVAGKCVGLPRDCDDGDPCKKDTCDPKAASPDQACAHEGLTGQPCDDGNTCTVGDKCLLGTCKGGGLVCECTKDADCAAYDDTNACTGKLTCQSGSCAVDVTTLPVCGTGVCRVKAADKASCEKGLGAWASTTKVCVYGKATNQGDCAANGHTWDEGGPCRVAQCEPSVGQCVLKSIFDGTACADGDACTSQDACVGGKCTGGAVDCDDGNACTDDSCDKDKGCVHAANTAPCDDGNACTGGDTCADGGCVGKGTCGCEKDAECAKFNAKDDKCAGTWACVDKNCQLDPKTVVSCDTTKDPLCVKTTCDKATGSCKPVDLAEGVTCTDGSVCTKIGTCKAGKCEGQDVVKSCDDGNPCTDDTCDANVGCVFKDNNAPCDDGDPCSKDDACLDGACGPGKDTCECTVDKDCDGLAPGNKCLGGYACVASAGKCMWDPAKSVTCGLGVCSDGKSKTALACQSSGAKWSPDSTCAKTACEPTTGQCKQTKATDGAACSDDSPCTLKDACKDGACVGTPNVCDDFNPCTTDSCDPGVLGGCVIDAKALEGKACEDGNLCTEASACTGGKCVGAKEKVCKDDNPCTKDACQTGKGCVFPASTDPCDDGDQCTLGDLCDGKLGKCLPGQQAKKCDDGNLCTDDSCDKDKGCVQLPNKVTCDDNDPCTLPGKCEGTSCDNGPKKTCNDDNPCTADSCDKNKLPDGCVFDPISGDCDDGSACTEKDTCVFGKGVCFGANIQCDDENVCTLDSCDPKKGCQYAPTQGTCGPFAKCVDPGDGKAACAFTGTKKVLVSELYVGDPCDPLDDYIELHSSLDNKTDLAGYVVQTRPAGSTNLAEWKTRFAFKKGDEVPANGYLLLAAQGAKLPGGVKPDYTSKGFSLDPEGLQIRVFDLPHTLLHDAVAWGVGAKGGEGTPLAPWPAARAMERRASSKSTAKLLAPWGGEWLAGNDVDTGDNKADFVERVVPDPQNKSVYEPACGGTCTGGKVCDFAGKGAAKCVADTKCSLGCGPGQKCSTLVSSCVVDSANRVVLSEVLVHAKGDAKAQFVELYNAGAKSADLSGLQLYVKGSGTSGAGSWGGAVAQIPGGTTMPPKRYYLIATAAWAGKNAGVDLVVPTLKLDKLGGAVKLVDPRTDVELDRFGWGKSPNPTGTALSVSEVPEGFPMVRKASAQSNGLSMAPGGDEELAGNGLDTQDDSKDWLILLQHTAHSLGGGDYAPACGGKCAAGLRCNYVAGAEKCVDPSCAGACNKGAVCNVKTGKCDLRVVISQFDALGPAFKGGDKTTNEYVELYNPGYVAADIGGLVLRFLDQVSGVKTVSPIFPTGICVNQSNAPCAGSDTNCRCQGEGVKPCTANSQCTKLTIPPRGYLLVAPLSYDTSLPKPDLQHTTVMAMVPARGALQLIRTDGSKFPDGSSVADQVCWGNMNKFGCKPETNLPSFETLELTCAVARKPRSCSTSASVSDPKHAHHYQGHSLWSGLNQASDWVTYCPRAPHASDHPAQGL